MFYEGPSHLSRTDSEFGGLPSEVSNGRHPGLVTGLKGAQ